MHHTSSAGIDLTWLPPADAMRGETDVSLSDVAKRTNAKVTCKELFAGAQAWRQGAEAVDEAEARSWKPIVVRVDGRNRIADCGMGDEIPGPGRPAVA